VSGEHGIALVVTSDGDAQGAPATVAIRTENWPARADAGLDRLAGSADLASH
jgi:hypothetical protein